MPSIKTQTIQIKNDKNISTEGTLHFTVYERQERAKRAIMALVGFWALAVLSIPILVLHYLLIPAFLFMGPYYAYRRLHDESVPFEVTGRCPTCNKTLNIQLEASDRLPMWSYCSAHNDPIHLVEVTGT